ncbi:MAG: hypothetical protein HXY44_00290 [Syntrophaceae bacterium]|nr:hypothetical protein [Syntrophaceae bacterium]
MSRLISGICLLSVTVLFLLGCATTVREKPKPAFVPTDQGTVIYEEKYEFKAPKGWKVLRVESGSDFEFGFSKLEGEYPSQTTFVYDDEPYGSSQDLEVRAKQYQALFFAATGLIMTGSSIEKAEVTGQSVVVLNTEGKNPNQNEKAKSKVYFVRRGDWIVSFLCTQWRPMNGAYEPKDFEVFDTFVKSFKFLKPNAFEEIIEQIEKLEG